MSIRLINEEKQEKTHKSYFLTNNVINGIEKIKESTKSEDYNEAFEKMIFITNKHLEIELNSNKG